MREPGVRTHPAQELKDWYRNTSKYLWYLLGASAAVIGCSSTPNGVAKLIEKAGVVERRGDSQNWESADIGAFFHLGQRVRTAAGARARLELRGGGTLQLAQSTTIMFSPSSPGKPSFAVEFGSAELQGSEMSEFALDIGALRLLKNSKVRLAPTLGGTRMQVEVLVGAVTLEGHGSNAVLGEGESVQARRPVAKGGAANVPGENLGVPLARDSVRSRSFLISQPPLGAFIRSGNGWRSLDATATRLPSNAEIQLRSGGRLEITHGTMVARLSGVAQFTTDTSDGRFLSMITGRVLMTNAESKVSVRVPGGVIAALGTNQSPAGAEILVDEQGVRILPSSGRVSVRVKGGGVEIIDVGKRARLDPRGVLQVNSTEPKRTDLVIIAGESSVVHDPNPPSTVRVRFDDRCVADGVVETARQKSFRQAQPHRGDGNAVFSADRSLYYRIRCVEDGVLTKSVRASGRIRVVRDSGQRPLVPNPPLNRIAVDGRLYNVLYQNRPPAFVFHWPEARVSESYTLRVKPASGRGLRFLSDAPEYVVPSGRLREGAYLVWFEVPGAKRSKTTTVRIEFDNAAPTAYLQAPSPGAPWTGATVEFAGAALPGWEVAVDGSSLETDSEGRFSVVVPVTGQNHAVAVRFSRRGQVHYYLRRNAQRRRVP